MQLGIFGGTFDPIHLGHLIVAETAREVLQLERVLFVLAPQPPHKQTQEITPSQHRLAMLELALADHPSFAISTLELQRSGPSYTVDTLRAFKQFPEYSHAQFYLIIGQDSLVNFHTWREPEAILQLATLAVYPRLELQSRAIAPELQGSYLNLEAPMIDLSSKDIRRRMNEQKSIRYLAPESVRGYLEANKLYV